ncbi:major facilitator superfamily domain-containing protein [Zopfochytrium polystomum]|nr:major facilitator superfamily domain-containing protein [Zopfochytrium polystomum]
MADTAAAAAAAADTAQAGKHVATTKQQQQQLEFAVAVVEGGEGGGGNQPEESAAATLPVDSTAVTDPRRIAPSLSNWQFALLFLGLSTSTFLAALDVTIVAVAFQAIADEFAAQDQVAWVATAYLLTSTAFVPLYGQLADIFGRKPTFLFAIVVFEVGSALCGVANSMALLVLGRAIAGIGGSGIFSLVLIIIADLVRPQDRAKWSGMIGASFGFASLAGPLLGGVFVDHLSWRWVFYINLPLGCIAILAAILFLKVETQRVTNKLAAFASIDWLGTALLVGAVVCILIPLQGGGTQYAWDSAVVVSLFAVGAALVVAFAVVQAKVAKNPLVPTELVRDPKVAATLLATFFFGCSFYGFIYYVPQWYQIALGDSATSAGVRSLPFVLGAVAVSMTTGTLSSATSLAWPFIPASSLLLSLAAILCSLLSAVSTTAAQLLAFLLAGVGTGLSMQMLPILAQFAAAPHLLATATALSGFCETLGGAVGLAAFAAAFNAVLPGKVEANLERANVTLHFLVPAVGVESLYRSAALVRTALPPEEWGPVVDGYVESLRVVFYCMVATSVMIGVCALFMKKDRLPSGKDAPQFGH